MVVTHGFLDFFFVCPCWRISYKTGAVSVLFSAVSSCTGTIQKYSANIYWVPRPAVGAGAAGWKNSNFRERRLESKRWTLITWPHSFIIRLKLLKKKPGILWNSGLTGGSGGPGWRSSPKEGCLSRCLKNESDELDRATWGFLLSKMRGFRGSQRFENQGRLL